MFSYESRDAETLISTNAVNTGGAIFTWLCSLAFIHIWKDKPKRFTTLKNTF